MFKHMEVWGNNRSVMPLDVLGRTRVTLIFSTRITWFVKIRVIFLVKIVLGIDLCNCRS